MTPLPVTKAFMKEFLHTEGSRDAKEQEKLAKQMKFRYRSGIGELIYPMVTCRPDLSYATTRAAQYSAWPAAIHYHGVRHTLRYLYATKDDGIYFWRPEPNELLPDHPLPRVNSNAHDLLADGRPRHEPRCR